MSGMKCFWFLLSDVPAAQVFWPILETKLSTSTQCLLNSCCTTENSGKPFRNPSKICSATGGFSFYLALTPTFSTMRAWRRLFLGPMWLRPDYLNTLSGRNDMESNTSNGTWSTALWPGANSAALQQSLKLSSKTVWDTQYLYWAFYVTSFSSWKCKPVGHLFFSRSSLYLFYSRHLQSTLGKCVTSGATPKMAAWLSRWCVASISIGLKESCRVTLQDLGGNLRIERAPPVLDCLGPTAELLSMQRVATRSKFLTGRPSNHFGMLRVSSNRSHKASAAFNSGAWRWRSEESAVYWLHFYIYVRAKRIKKKQLTHDSVSFLCGLFWIVTKALILNLVLCSVNRA